MFWRYWAGAGRAPLSGLLCRHSTFHGPFHGYWTAVARATNRGPSVLDPAHGVLDPLLDPLGLDAEGCRHFDDFSHYLICPAADPRGEGPHRTSIDYPGSLGLGRKSMRAALTAPPLLHRQELFTALTKPGALLGWKFGLRPSMGQCTHLSRLCGNPAQSRGKSGSKVLSGR